MSFCPLCGRGHGNGGDPCARCEALESAFERGEIDQDGNPNICSGEELTDRNMLYQHAPSINAPHTDQVTP